MKLLNSCRALGPLLAGGLAFTTSVFPVSSISGAEQVDVIAPLGTVANSPDGAPQPAPVFSYSPGVSEIVKMIDAKVDPQVVKAFIKNSQVAYNPTASEIIELKKAGVPDDVLTAMIQRGAEVRAQAPSTQPPPYAPAPTYAPAPATAYYDYTATPYMYNSYPYPYYSYAYPYYNYWWNYGFGWPFYCPFFYGFNACGSYYHPYHHGDWAHHGHNGAHPQPWGSTASHGFTGSRQPWAPVNTHTFARSGGTWGSASAFASRPIPNRAGVGFQPRPGGFSARSTPFVARSAGFSARAGSFGGGMRSGGSGGGMRSGGGFHGSGGGFGGHGGGHR